MMNFTNFKVTNINNYNACQETPVECFDVRFSYKIGEQKREGSISFEPEEVRIYTNFSYTPEEILARDDFRLLPNGEIEVIDYPNDSFVVGDSLTSEKEKFLQFLQSNGVQTTPEKGEEWYWQLYHNLEYYGDYNKSSL